MFCWQATIKIENKEDTVETEEIKLVTLLCKNNLLFWQTRAKGYIESHNRNIRLVQKASNKHNNFKLHIISNIYNIYIDLFIYISSYK